MMSDVKEKMLPLMVEYLALVTLGRLKDKDKIEAYRIDNYEDELIIKFTIDGQTWVKMELSVMNVLGFDDVDVAMASLLGNTDKILTQITATILGRRNAQRHTKNIS